VAVIAAKLDKELRWLPDKRNQQNHTIAQHTLDQELGRYGEELQQFYGFDRDIADTLLAHGRQDAAHALLNTMTLMKDVRLLKYLVLLVLGLVIVLLFR
jgi:hypothetical protein